MTMVFGCAVMQAIQAWVADLTGSYLTSYVVVLFCAAYILFYALVGSKNVMNIPKATNTKVAIETVVIIRRLETLPPIEAPTIM